MLVNNEEWHSQGHGDGAKIAHKDPVGGDLLLVTAVRANTSNNSDGSGVEARYKTRSHNVDQVI